MSNSQILLSYIGRGSKCAIHANQDINSMTIESTDLTGNGSTIPSTNVDVRIVKCWYQGGYGNSTDLSVHSRYLTPELLLKDDSLIKVTGEDWTKWNISNDNRKNYLKLATGSYIDISSSRSLGSGDMTVVPISKRPVIDATTLQPVTINKGSNKQFWITIHIPNNTEAGYYSGSITLKTGSVIIQQIKLNLQVLPIALSNPNIEYCLYYRGIITDQGSISSEDKTIAQFTAENKDMKDHGVTNPTIYSTPTDDAFNQVLSIRKQVGLNNTNLYCLGLDLGSSSKIPYYKNLTAPYGVTDVYVYAPDEQDIQSVNILSDITRCQNAGGKVMNAQSQSQADSAADKLDLAIVAHDPLVKLSDKYHINNHKIYSYDNPQVVPEYPRLFRMNYGLLLWQRNYDGAMTYSYQHSFGDIWNDFDCIEYRDHVFAYPTMDGVIDTVQWEGFRESVDDMRYLATLQNTINLAKSEGKDTSVAESWLANLKGSDLNSQDLDAVRLQMINYILSLQNSG